MKILNSKVILTLLVCAVFVCGVQLAFADPVSAATYKKFDSGNVKINGIGCHYYSTIKGNKIQVGIFYKNKLISFYELDKGKNKVTLYVCDSKGHVKYKQVIKTKKTLKSFYYYFNKLFIKELKS